MIGADLKLAENHRPLVLRQRTLLAAIWIGAMSVCVCLDAVAQQVSPPPSRWAIVASDPATRPLADLLTAELSAADEVQLVERDEIGRVLDELRLGASGLIDFEQAAKFGNISRADALVLLSVVGSEKRQTGLRLRLIDTRTSMRLLDTSLPSRSVAVGVASLRKELLSKLKTLSIPTRSLLLISVSPIMSGEPGYLLRGYCKTLTSLVGAEFHRHPEVVVLERDDLQRLTSESELSGIPLELRGATRVLETSIRRTDSNHGMVASCRIISPSDGAAVSLEIEIPSREIAKVREALVGGVLQAVGQRHLIKSGSPELEAQQFDRRGQQFTHAYRPKEAAEMAEAAYALAPSYERLRRCISRYNGAVLRGHDSKLDQLHLARRHNELRLHQESEYPRGWRGFVFSSAFNDPSREPNFPPPTAPKMPPKPKIQYQRPLTAEAPEEQAVLAEVHRLQRKVFDARIKNAKSVPRLQVFHLLRRIDLELHEIQHPANTIDLVTTLLERAFQLASESGVKSDLDDAWYRALVSRALVLVDKVHQSDKDSVWQVTDADVWTDRLGKIDRWLGEAIRLLWQSRDSSQAAGRLLETLSRLPPSAFQVEEIDKFLRSRALQRVAADLATRYAKDLMARTETSKDAEELLAHCDSAPGFFCGMNKNESHDLAKRITAAIKNYPSLRDDRARRLRWSIHRYVDHTFESEFSLERAPGPWQQYVARPIRLAEGGSVRAIYANRDAPSHGELILIRGQGTVVLERLNLATGKSAQHGPEFEMSKAIGRAKFLVRPDAIYVALPKFGITKVAANSAERLSEREGAASSEIFSLAWLDHLLYIGYKDAFGSFDPATKQFELFASSTSAQPRNPLDGRGSFFIRYLVADERQKCLWLSVQHHGPGYKQCGLWKFTPATEKYEHIDHSLVELSHADGGLLTNKSRDPRVAWLDLDSGQLVALPQYAHAAIRHSNWLAKPTPHLIKIGDHLIGSNGTLMTADGKTHRLPGTHHWNWLQPIGSGFVTHYEFNSRTIWYIQPKQL